MRFTARASYPGETRWGVFQNRFPREWPDLWYFTFHLGPLHLEITGT